MKRKQNRICRTIGRMRGEFLRKTEKLKGEKTSSMQNISKQFKRYFIDMGGRGSNYMLSSLIVILIRKGRICLVYKCIFLRLFQHFIC